MSYESTFQTFQTFVTQTLKLQHQDIIDCTNQLTTNTVIIVRRMVVYVALKMTATTPTSSATMTGHHLMRKARHPPGVDNGLEDG